MCDGLIKKEDDKIRYYEYIQKETIRLSRLIDDLLELSRLQSGSVAIEKRKMRIYDLIYDISYHYQTMAKEKGCSLITNISENDSYAYSNPDRIEEVLIALLDNAFKHNTDGEQIEINVEEFINNYQISVINKGHIAKTDIEHIFERFYKVDRAHSGNGTGLGLAISKEILDLLGEKIWVESKEGLVKFSFTVAKYV